MRVNVYWDGKKGTVVVPTTAKAEAGFWLEIEPVEVALADQPSSVVNAIMRSASRSGVIVATPTRATFPKPVVLKHAKTKSWSEFEKTHQMLSLERTSDGQYLITLQTRSIDGGYEPGIGGAKELPAGSTLREAVEALIPFIH